MASITKTATTDGGSRWRVRFRTPNGESRERWFPRRRDAEAWLATTEAAKLTGAFADPKLGRRTFGDWWNAWRSTRVDLRPSTVARDDSYYRNHLEGRFARLPLGRIDRTMLREWVAELSASGLAPATVHKCAQLMRSRCGGR